MAARGCAAAFLPRQRFGPLFCRGSSVLCLFSAGAFGGFFRPRQEDLGEVVRISDIYILLLSRGGRYIEIIHTIHYIEDHLYMEMIIYTWRSFIHGYHHLHGDHLIMIECSSWINDLLNQKCRQFLLDCF